MMMRVLRGRMGGGCRNRGHAAIEQMAWLQYQSHPASPVIFVQRNLSVLTRRDNILSLTFQNLTIYPATWEKDLPCLIANR
jgi:hypothetical protein